MIIDFHCHIGKSKVFYPMESGGPADIVKVMDRRNIDKVVLFPAGQLRKPPRYYEDVLQAAKEFPDRFIPFFGANPKDERSVEMLEMVVTKYGFKGLKFHTYSSGVAANDRLWVYPLAEKARELKICFMVHSDPYITGTPWQVALLAMDFPDLPIVMAHMGFMDVVCNDAAIKMAKRCPNIYLETCGVSSEAHIAKAVRELGAHRVMHGSDMPFHDPGFDIARIQYAPISEEEKKMVLGGSAQRLLDSLGK
jgi:hypothetical protein